VSATAATLTRCKVCRQQKCKPGEATCAKCRKAHQRENERNRARDAEPRQPQVKPKKVDPRAELKVIHDAIAALDDLRGYSARPDPDGVVKEWVDERIRPGLGHLRHFRTFIGTTKATGRALRLSEGRRAPKTDQQHDELERQYRLVQAGEYARIRTAKARIGTLLKDDSLDKRDEQRLLREMTTDGFGCPHRNRKKWTNRYRGQLRTRRNASERSAPLEARRAQMLVPDWERRELRETLLRQLGEIQKTLIPDCDCDISGDNVIRGAIKHPPFCKRCQQCVPASYGPSNKES
jgi:hypothetical protein